MTNRGCRADNSGHAAYLSSSCALLVAAPSCKLLTCVKPRPMRCAGGEMGRAWHAGGARSQKINGVWDLLAGIDALEAAAVAHPGHIAGHAVSAGAYRSARWIFRASPVLRFVCQPRALRVACQQLVIVPLLPLARWFVAWSCSQCEAEGLCSCRAALRALGPAVNGDAARLTAECARVRGMG